MHSLPPWEAPNASKLSAASTGGEETLTSERTYVLFLFMAPPAPPMEDRHSAMLAELAAMSLTLARDLQNRALEAESVEDAARLAAAFHQVSRGLRQTLALELKVIRYKDSVAREAAEAAEAKAAAERLAVETHAQAMGARREALRDQVGRCIWTEGEDLSRDEFPEGFEPPEDPERLARDLERWLDIAVQRPDFVDADFDLLAIEACDVIGADANILYEIHEPAPRAAPQPGARQPGVPQPADSS